MNRIGICVFSGTGNTDKCAKALSAALADRGFSCALHAIKDGTETAAERDLVICYPVYGFNAPMSVIRFCRSLPAGDGNIWFLKTSGEPLKLNDNSSAELIRIITKKGYRTMGEFHFIMPYNMVFRHTDEMASLMWETARRRIPAAADTIAEGKAMPIRAPFRAKAVSALCRIEHGFYPLNGRLFRADEKRCVRCMKCVRDCPVNNIRAEEGRLRFGKNCAGCMRCSFSCPSDAIRIGLLDFMRVNGPYDFSRDPGKAEIGRFCRKAYRRYFSEEKRP